MQSKMDVSVICPLYNMGYFLEGFIISYQKQKNVRKELIIIDDASSDDSLEIAQRFAEKDPSIKVISLTTNKGSGNARNVGIDNARGEFVIFCDPDDRLAFAFSLCHMYKECKRYNSEIAFGNYYVCFISDDKLAVPAWSYSAITQKIFLKWSDVEYLSIWQCLIKRDLLNKNNIRFTNSRRCQDVIFLAELSLYSEKLLALPTFIYKYTLLYRFVNLNYDTINSIYEGQEKVLSMIMNTANQTKYRVPNFVSDSADVFPWSVACVIPFESKVTTTLLEKYYDISLKDGQELLKKFNLQQQKYQLLLDRIAIRNKDKIQRIIYRLNKISNLTFIKNTETDEIYTSNKNKIFFSKIKKIHLYGYEKGFTSVVDQFNEDEDLHLFVRTADILPLQHLYSSPNRRNVVDDVNLLGLSLIIDECKNLESIYLHSLYPAATFIFLNNRPEFIDKCILSLCAININLEKFDSRVIKVLSKIKQTYYSLQSDYELLKGYLNSSVFIKKPFYFTKKKLLSEYIFKVPITTLVLSNSYTIALDTLHKYEEDRIACVFFDLLPYTKKKLAEKLKNLKVSFIDGYAFYYSAKDYLSKATKVVYNVDNFFDIELVVFCILNKIEIVSDLPRNQQLIQEIKRIRYEHMKISIFGVGYVGFSLAVLLARKYEVSLFDINIEKLKLIENKVSPLKEQDIVDDLEHENLNLKVVYDVKDAIVDTDIVIVCTPTNFDHKTNAFNTSSILEVLNWILEYKNKDTQVVIKSTVPIGFTENLAKEKNIDFLHFSPEFLREGNSIKDNLYPSRIIVGSFNHEFAKIFSDILKSVALKEDIEVLFTSPTEAEAIKLFSNTYLAMRVAFFNELDSFAMVNKLDAKTIINGVCLDKRIGFSYNNPSFGYGGYCLPKDTKQLETNYKDIPHSIVKAIIEANTIRKELIVTEILKRKVNVVGIYRLVMKAGSDNFRESSIIDILKGLQVHNIKIVLYEPSLFDNEFYGVKVIKDFNDFVSEAEIIVANRVTDELLDCKDKVFSRDIFHVS